MLFAEKMCVSETVIFRPWFVMFWVLAKGLGAAYPGEPPGMNDTA